MFQGGAIYQIEYVSDIHRYVAEPAKAEKVSINSVGLQAVVQHLSKVFGEQVRDVDEIEAGAATAD